MTSHSSGIGAKIGAYVELLKTRLSLLVAISAVFGYAIAADGAAAWTQMLWVGLGGMMITGASNVLNQISERDLDKLMKRTQNRPLPTGRLTVRESLVYALVLAIAGVTMLGYFFNLPAALLGIIGLLSYAFVYTPLKKISGISVFVGAFPGALPPLIGWVAYTGTLGLEGLLLFMFQFMWQFPHFWAIAWIADEDYKRAGFKMLPSAGGKSKYTAGLILAYTLCLAPMAFFPWEADMIGGWGVLGLVLAALAFAWPAFRLYRTLDDRYARKLMFSSFWYLPLIQILFMVA
ncbi:heme o synthase [Pontibacter sp. G13]|uniref:heme o synthase n=1 Tax=Pontibacter sp. G13 TaxID=3074898 RepID=UPI00288B6B0B|nr:heme o synthase [Pontibacter sp. G13]WNJ16607.1 heme o synthase [Pontibacter sp. G13]